MSAYKILLIFGTRPEAIKMAPLYHELKKTPDEFSVFTCVTAQHRQMLDQVLNHFEIIPDVDLNLMKSGQDLTELTSSILLSLKDVFSAINPDLVLVHGDTTTSLSAAMAAFYAGIKVGHVEAGLRTHNILSPYPEEFNRVVTSKIAHIHFAPTETAQANLIKEGVTTDIVFVTGNTVIDALLWTSDQLDIQQDRRLRVLKELSKELNFEIDKTKYILITGHRRENYGDGFVNITNAIHELAKTFANIKFVYPVHLNPKARVSAYEQLQRIDNVFLINPLDYESFIYLLRNCFLVLTDSGGIQEEAPSFGKPVLLMRESTERPEAVNAGTVSIIGSNQARIVQAVSHLINNNELYKKMSLSINPYGDGTASKKISNILKIYLNKK
jgi:UDP-N-acetylglucosamine 2-epimerase (non-hydrolysing)